MNVNVAPGRSGPLTSLEAALERLLEGLGPIEPVTLPLDEAEGLILAEPLVTPRPVPSTGLALVAGWAVSSADLIGASPYAPAPLPDAVAVGPGEVLPTGADAVLPMEAAEEAGCSWTATCSLAPGENVRRAGEDAPTGAVLRRAGERVRGLDIAVALAAGLTSAEVRRPVVRVVGGESSDAVNTLLAHMAERCGASVASGEGSCDCLVWTGWADPGFDESIAWRLAVRPGEEVACGMLGGRPALRIPDRLDAAFAAALVLLEPCLRRLTGASPQPEISAPVTAKIVSAVGFTEFALLRRGPEGFEPLGVSRFGLEAIARADLWLAVPPESEGCARGETVRAHPL